MVRAPCCEKMGLKKGPWTPEEDQLLVSYIENHGHGNWRALPKQAGLLRCGKSCRLRWINYLRPDIKRGNFTAEEEETIIKLHEMLGNRWSAIAAKLPGRTDNEIKNVWHTHLKKRLQKTNNYEAHHQAAKTISGFKPNSIKRSVSNSSTVTNQSEAASFITSSSSVSATSSSDHNDQSNMNVAIKCEGIDSSLEPYVLPQIIDESFWSEEAAMDDNIPSGLLQLLHQYPSDNSASESFQQQQGYGFNNGLNLDDGMDFWYEVFIRTGDFTELTF